eukprot:CAMPEP_0175624768 /NCGR_PEP_ID=MMETSP0096-20121207/70130_1 /TAXON_ID=311494 /ORGANISM="Alexandrium monilatum, Strain CCMP3105" /LENGTH=115 /DNA_ID=CAMNT_0016930097 /DNA_START=28 /DNA_END=372 /DNA_ORIENTATION=+
MARSTSAATLPGAESSTPSSHFASASDTILALSPALVAARKGSKSEPAGHDPGRMSAATSRRGSAQTSHFSGSSSTSDSKTYCTSEGAWQTRSLMSAQSAACAASRTLGTSTRPS